jgi:predicted ATP-dependent endonuclease of OLD family
MPIAQVRIKNYRAFSDSGMMAFGPVTPIAGRNDVGKSGILHALRVFFEPPKKGLDVSDIHGKDQNGHVEIEIAFDPKKLSTQEVQIDAKNKIHLIDDRLVDSQGLLRLRLSISVKQVEAFQMLIEDVDDDSMFPLAIKNQEQLLELLTRSGLPAIKAGKETNQEKRASLRKKALSDGRKLVEKWVDASEVQKAIREILPLFVFFSDTANYDISETRVQNQFKGIVDKALTVNPNAKQIESDICATIQTEFDKVFERLRRLTDGVTSVEADARVNWKKAVDGIGLSWADTSGISIPYELRGAGVRRLFMVAYFQYEVAESMHEPSGPRYIFAVEEPEVHLHPGAQRDLNIAFQELSDLGHLVIYTTHSPVFVSTAPTRDVILVVRPGPHAETRQVPQVDPASIADELGVEASDRLVGKNYVILVEGQKDVGFYRNVLSHLYTARLTSLDPNTVLFLQCGGISNLRFNVTTRCIDEAGLSWAVIADSDRQSPGGPPGRDTQELQNNCPKSCASLQILSRSCIENYLDPKTVRDVTGIDCLIPIYGKPTESTGKPLSHRKLQQVKDAGPSIIDRMGVSGIVAHSTMPDNDCEFVTLFENIRVAFRK